MRNASISGSTLALVGDLNATTTFEIIAPSSVSSNITFNGANLSLNTTSYGTITASKDVSLPSVALPDLGSISWVCYTPLELVIIPRLTCSVAENGRQSSRNPVKLL